MILLLAAATAVVLAVAGCHGSGAAGHPEAASPRLPVFAGIPPVAYLVERIGGRWVEVGTLVQPGQNPHLFQPSPRQVLALKKAALFFKIGMPFESRLVDLLESRQRRTTVVDTAAGIPRQWLADECCEEEAAPGGSHCEEDHHAGGPDPHVWMTPPNLKIMATKVATALEKADPGHAGDFRCNLAALAQELDRLDARLRRTLEPFRGQTFYVFHPAFGYLAHEYHLQQKSVETEGKAPTPRRLLALIKQARAEGVKIIFLQPQFDARCAEAIAAAIGGAVVPLDSLAPDPAKNLDEVAAKIQNSFPL